MKLAILIPALNEEKTIGNVIDSIPEKFSGITEKRIIVVNDGSVDRTQEIAEKKGALVIRHAQNLGLGKSFQDGLEKSLEIGANILVTIDADGQFNALEIPELLKPILNREADFVTGSRFISKSHIPRNMPFIKKWGNHKVAMIISWATGNKFHDVSCGFRAYNREAMLRMNLFGKFTYTQETFLDIAYKGLNIKEIPVTVIYHNGRRSRVAGSILKYGLKSADIIWRTIKDYKPLSFFVGTGLTIFFIGLFLDVAVLIHYFYAKTFSPYKIFGFLGAFLNAIGVMVIFIGILADLIDKVRMTEEKILFYEKKKYYEKNIDDLKSA